jgi:hypothetical protein
VVGKGLLLRTDLGSAGILHNVHLSLIASAVRGVVEIEIVSERVDRSSILGTERGRHDESLAIGIILEDDQLCVEVQGLRVVQVVV